MMNSESAIASLATAAGQGAVALVRMSGQDSLDILARCTPPGFTEKMEPRYARLVHILGEDGLAVDQVLATWFKGPGSYTGEELVEIACHGGMFVTGRVLERLYACGARPAEPGEFTKRAFLNGRMDLTQAEAVMDIISASSDLALKAAGEQLEGAIGNRVRLMTDRLVHVLAHVEAFIDFPDEDISPDTAGLLLTRIDEVRADIRQLLATSDQGRILREGIRTVIAGRPNAGKSSLLNLLLGYERAIVSDVEGTTRDTVEEILHLGGLALRLIDTAGLRHSDDLVEQAGIERTGRAIANADLVIEVADASLPRPEEDHDFLSGSVVPRILVLNKCDLGVHESWSGKEGVRFSCAEGYGRDELEKTLVAIFSSSVHMAEGASLASINARHQGALKSSLASLDLAYDSVARGESPELSSLALREARDFLGEITGRTDTEEILGAIFSTFCIGK